MASLRVGVVGSRFAARLHVTAYRRAYGVEARLAGVTSPTAERREAFARETGATPYPSLAAMLPHVDVVDVCAPPAHHEPVALEAIEAGRHVVIEKPFTGAFGSGDPAFAGHRASKDALLKEALASAGRIVSAARRRGVVLGYAENWIYAPAIQKEREIIEKTGAQILWMLGGESHSGSHSPVYGIWRHAGGGSLVGKGCHPLSACLYLKQVEGRARAGRPIRPASVSCRVHEITRLPGYQDRGFLRTDYERRRGLQPAARRLRRRHRGRRLRDRAGAGRRAQLARGIRQQPPDDVPAEPGEPARHLQPRRRPVQGRLRGREDRDEGGLESSGRRRGVAAGLLRRDPGLPRVLRERAGAAVRRHHRPRHDRHALRRLLSAERGGQEVAVPIAPLAELESG